MRMIERLEARQMFAAAAATTVHAVLRGGNLAIVGTADDDVINIGDRPGDAGSVDQIDVFANGSTIATFDAARVRRIIVLGGLGDDAIDAGNYSSEFQTNLPDDAGVAVPVILIGGLGNDLLAGSSRADIINGGPGDDRLWGQAGNDVLIGGPGNDSLDGGLGVDHVIGGPGVNNYLTSDAPAEIIGWHRSDHLWQPSINGVLTLVDRPSASSSIGSVTMAGSGVTATSSATSILALSATYTGAVNISSGTLYPISGFGSSSGTSTLTLTGTGDSGTLNSNTTVASGVILHFADASFAGLSSDATYLKLLYNQQTHALTSADPQAMVPDGSAVLVPAAAAVLIVDPVAGTISARAG